MNCRRGLPDPQTTNGVPFSVAGERGPGQRSSGRLGLYPLTRQALTLGEVSLVAEAGEDVSVLDRVVVVRSEDVGGDDRGEVVSELVVVGAARDGSQGQ